jgi:hypothetical protein
MKPPIVLATLCVLFSACTYFGGPRPGDIAPSPFYSEKGSSELISFDKVYVDQNGRTCVRATGRQVYPNESYDETGLSESQKEILAAHSRALASRSSRERFFRDRDGQRDEMRMR